MSPAKAHPLQPASDGFVDVFADTDVDVVDAGTDAGLSTGVDAEAAAAEAAAAAAAAAAASTAAAAAAERERQLNVRRKAIQLQEDTERADGLVSRVFLNRPLSDSDLAFARTAFSDPVLRARAVDVLLQPLALASTQFLPHAYPILRTHTIVGAAREQEKLIARALQHLPPPRLPPLGYRARSRGTGGGTHSGLASPSEGSDSGVGRRLTLAQLSFSPRTPPAAAGAAAAAASPSHALVTAANAAAAGGGSSGGQWSGCLFDSAVPPAAALAAAAAAGAAAAAAAYSYGPRVQPYPYITALTPDAATVSSDLLPNVNAWESHPYTCAYCACTTPALYGADFGAGFVSSDAAGWAGCYGYPGIGTSAGAGAAAAADFGRTRAHTPGCPYIHYPYPPSSTHISKLSHSAFTLGIPPALAAALPVATAFASAPGLGAGSAVSGWGVLPALLSHPDAAFAYQSAAFLPTVLGDLGAVQQQHGGLISGRGDFVSAPLSLLPRPSLDPWLASLSVSHHAAAPAATSSAATAAAAAAAAASGPLSPIGLGGGSNGGGASVPLLPRSLTAGASAASAAAAAAALLAGEHPLLDAATVSLLHRAHGQYGFTSVSHPTAPTSGSAAVQWAEAAWRVASDWDLPLPPRDAEPSDPALAAAAALLPPPIPLYAARGAALPPYAYLSSAAAAAPYPGAGLARRVGGAAWTLQGSAPAFAAETSHFFGTASSAHPSFAHLATASAAAVAAAVAAATGTGAGGTAPPAVSGVLFRASDRMHVQYSSADVAAGVSSATAPLQAVSPPTDFTALYESSARTLARLRADAAADAAAAAAGASPRMSAPMLVQPMCAHPACLEAFRARVAAAATQAPVAYAATTAAAAGTGAGAGIQGYTRDPSYTLSPVQGTHALALASAASSSSASAPGAAVGGQTAGAPTASALGGGLALLVTPAAPAAAAAAAAAAAPPVPARGAAAASAAAAAAAAAAPPSAGLFQPQVPRQIRLAPIPFLSLLDLSLVLLDHALTARDWPAAIALRAAAQEFVTFRACLRYEPPRQTRVIIQPGSSHGYGGAGANGTPLKPGQLVQPSGASALGIASANANAAAAAAAAAATAAAGTQAGATAAAAAASAAAAAAAATAAAASAAAAGEKPKKRSIFFGRRDKEKDEVERLERLRKEKEAAIALAHAEEETARASAAAAAALAAAAIPKRAGQRYHTEPVQVSLWARWGDMPTESLAQQQLFREHPVFKEPPLWVLAVTEEVRQWAARHPAEAALLMAAQERPPVRAQTQRWMQLRTPIEPRPRPRMPTGPMTAAELDRAEAALMRQLASQHDAHEDAMRAGPVVVVSDCRLSLAEASAGQLFAGWLLPVLLEAGLLMSDAGASTSEVKATMRVLMDSPANHVPVWERDHIEKVLGKACDAAEQMAALALLQ
jgi:hypothetical protein